MRKFSEQINEQRTSPKRDFGCLMYNFTIENWVADVLSKIDEKDLYKPEEDSFGLEKDPHITALYGFEDDKVSLDKLYDFVKKVKDVDVLIGDVSIFEGEAYDVLKFDINSDTLVDLNKVLTENFDYKTDFPNYHPHMTIGYFLKGEASKYFDVLKEITFDIKKPLFCYSRVDYNKVYFEIKK